MPDQSQQPGPSQVNPPGLSTGSHFFQNARHINIHGGTYVSVAGNVNIFQGDSAEYGLAILRQASAEGASHDSSQRYPPPRCHLETRREVLKVLAHWMENPNSCGILWLCGPMGVGKSAIAQTFAESCESSGTLGTTFFFSRGDKHRGTIQNLSATLAYQLAFSMPGVRSHIDLAARDHPTGRSTARSFEAQFKGLIIKPFRDACMPASERRLVIIDGLDECEEPLETQQALLRLIGDVAADRNTPLRFMITSRPEPHIRHVFEALNDVSYGVILNESFEPDRDIEIYLRDEFRKIVEERNLLMSLVPRPWPSDQVINFLVQKASGQFLYASTILSFVSDENCRPEEQLDAVLKTAMDSSPIFSAFDRLYRHILQSSADRDDDLRSVARVLNLIKVLHCPQPHTVLEDILGLKYGEVLRILRRLHSLLALPAQFDCSQSDSSGWPIHILHASFREFLGDCRRSGNFYIDEATSQADLCLQSFRMMANWVFEECRSQVQLNHPPSPKTLSYLKRHLAHHYFVVSPSSRDSLLGYIRRQMCAGHFGIHIDQTLFSVVHTMMTVLVNMLYTSMDYPLPRCCNSYELSDDDILSAGDVFSFGDEEEKTVDPKVLDIYRGYCSILYHLYHLALSTSSDLNRLLQLLPGWPLIYEHLPLQGIAKYFGADPEIISELFARCDCFLSVYDHGDGIRRFMLSRHVSEFIFDQSKSQQCFDDPINNPSYHRLQLACQCVRLLHGCHQSDRSIPSYSITGLRALPCTFLYPHQFSIQNLNNVESDQLGDFLRPLQLIQEEDQCLLWPYHAHKLNFYWVGVQFMLSWIWEQLKVLEENQGHIRMQYHALIDELYHEILYVERNDGGAIIKLRHPFAACIKQSRQTSSDSPPMWDTAFQPVTIPSYTNRVSEELLLINIHPLVDFLTNPLRAGELFIKSTDYHTQMAEHQLMRLTPDALASQDPHEKWLRDAIHYDCDLFFHLTHSSPSPIILQHLQSFMPHIIKFFSYKHVQRLIKWLENIPLASSYPMDVYWHSRNVLDMMQTEGHMTRDGGEQPEEDNGADTPERDARLAATISNLRRKLNGMSIDYTLIMSPGCYKLSHIGDDDTDAVLKLTTETLLSPEGEL